MSKYATLIAQIAANIRRNGAQAITGDLLQEQLLAMITSLGEYYQFGGLVSHDTEFTPGDEPVVFIAATPGTYTNFGGLVVADNEVALLIWSGSAWSKQTTDIATRTEVSQLGQETNLLNEQIADIGFPFSGLNVAGRLGFQSGTIYNNKIVYDGVTTRLLSTLIPANIGDNVLYITNESSSPALKIKIFKREHSTKNYVTKYDFFTSGTKEVQCNEADTDFFVLLVGRTDESNISPSDVNGITATLFGNGLPEKGIQLDRLCESINFSLVAWLTGEMKTLGWLPVETYQTYVLPSKTRISTRQLLFTPYNLTIKAPTNCKLYMWTYDSDGSNPQSGSWKQEIDINAGTYFRLNVRKDPETTISNVNELIPTLTYCSYLYDEITPHSSDAVKSSSIFNGLRDVKSSVLSLEDGNITSQLGFVRGLPWGSKIEYVGITTRLVSNPIQVTGKTGTIRVSNTSSSPALKVMVSKKLKDTGAYSTIVSWSTSSEVTFDTKISDAVETVITLAKTDDSDLTVADINGISVSIEHKDESDGILALNPELSDIVPKISNIRRNYNQYGHYTSEYSPCLVLLHFSDIHANNDNLLRIKEFQQKYSQYINDVLQTGDLIGGEFNDGMPSAYAQTTSFLNVIGNHDSTNRNGTQWDLVSQKDVYDVVIAPYVSNWGVVQPDNASSEGYCYYYKDYTDEKVRLVVLDNMHWDSTQKTWLEGVLASAKTGGFHIVCALHYPPFPCTKQPNNPFDAVIISTGNTGQADAQISASIKDFIDAGGIFVCYLCGHIHQDVFGLGASVNNNNQLVISIACADDTIHTYDPYSEMARVNGTRSQDCFNLFAVDTTTKTLKIMRVGANYDRYMRRRNTLSWDYENNQLIYVD